MRDKISAFLIKSLTTKIAPMVYIMMAVSVVIGFCFSTGALVGHGESILFKEGALISAPNWGFLLFISAGTAFVGLVLKNDWCIKTGSFCAFVLYVMACIQLVQDGHLYAFLIFGLFHLLFMGYVYLSSSLGVLERESLTRYRD